MDELAERELYEVEVPLQIVQVLDFNLGIRLIISAHEVAFGNFEQLQLAVLAIFIGINNTILL